MEDDHGVQLMSFHLDLDPYRSCGAMQLLFYLDIILHSRYSSMHLLIFFLFGSMLVHKCVDDHVLSLMIVVSLYGVDGDIQQL
jgi:hypothetical protein